MIVGTVKIDGIGSYRLRTYFCPARTGRDDLWWDPYHHPYDDPPIVILEKLQAGTLYCRFCGQHLYPDRSRKSSYTEQLVIVEELV